MMNTSSQAFWRSLNPCVVLLALSQLMAVIRASSTDWVPSEALTRSSEKCVQNDYSHSASTSGVFCGPVCLISFFLKCFSLILQTIDCMEMVPPLRCFERY